MMNPINLQTVGELLVIECVLCGEECDVEGFEDHALAHAQRGECWTYGSFAGACELDQTLEGWPVQSLAGELQLWPFWIDGDPLEALSEIQLVQAVCV